MIITVHASRGNNSYQVDTDEVTCTCPDFRFRCCHFPVTSEKRQCKHLRGIYKESPNLMPPIVANAMRQLDEQLNKISNDSNLTFPRDLIESYHTLMTTYLNWHLIAVGDFAKGESQCFGLNYIMNCHDYKRSDLDAVIDLIGELVTDEEDYVRLLGDGFVPITISKCSEFELLFKQLFGTTKEDELQKLVDRAAQLGYILNPTGLGGYSGEKIQNIEELYKILDLPYVKI